MTLLSCPVHESLFGLVTRSVGEVSRNGYGGVDRNASAASGSLTLRDLASLAVLRSFSGDWASRPNGVVWTPVMWWANLDWSSFHLRPWMYALPLKLALIANMILSGRRKKDH